MRFRRTTTEIPPGAVLYTVGFSSRGRVIGAVIKGVGNGDVGVTVYSPPRLQLPGRRPRIPVRTTITKRNEPGEAVDRSRRRSMLKRTSSAVSRYPQARESVTALVAFLLTPVSGGVWWMAKRTVFVSTVLVAFREGHLDRAAATKLR